ncbi:MAG: hypothetical protein ACLR6B_06915 [Blautia sp.]
MTAENDGEGVGETEGFFQDMVEGIDEAGRRNVHNPVPEQDIEKPFSMRIKIILWRGLLAGKCHPLSGAFDGRSEETGRKRCTSPENAGKSGGSE